MKKYIFSTLILIFILLIPPLAFGDVKINEVYPCPVTGQTEWVELYNDSEQEVDLVGYYLKDIANNNITITTDKIPSYGFVSVTSMNILNNSGDTLYLFNKDDDQIDSISYQSITSEKSYGRCPNGRDDFYVFNESTKDQSNNDYCNKLTPTFAPTLTPTPQPTPKTPSATLTLTPIINDIFISEIMPFPSTGNNEWFEIYNGNSYTVTLTDWYFDDIEDGGSNPKIFSITIPAKSYKVYNLTSNIFNNDQDDIRLLDNINNLIDSFSYEDPQSGLSFSRVDFDQENICLTNPSPNTSHGDCISDDSGNTDNPTITQSLITQSTTTITSLIPTPSIIPTNTNNVKYLDYFKNNKPGSLNSVKKQLYNIPKILGAQTSKTTNNRKYYQYQQLFISLSFFFAGQNIIYIIYKINSNLKRNSKS